MLCDKFEVLYTILRNLGHGHFSLDSTFFFGSSQVAKAVTFIHNHDSCVGLLGIEVQLL